MRSQKCDFCNNVDDRLTPVSSVDVLNALLRVFPNARPFDPESVLYVCQSCRNQTAKIAPQTQPTLDPNFMTELPPDYRFSGCSVEIVVKALSDNCPALFEAFDACPSQEMRRKVLSEFASSFGRGWKKKAAVDAPKKEYTIDTLVKELTELSIRFASTTDDVLSEDGLKIDSLYKFIESSCPALQSLLNILFDTGAENSPRDLAWKRRQAFLPLISLIKIRSQKALSFDVLLTAYFYGQGASEQVNHFLSRPVTVSYEELKEKFRVYAKDAESRLRAICSSNRGFNLVSDKLNIHVGADESSPGTMFNCTAGFIVERNVPTNITPHVPPPNIIFMNVCIWLKKRPELHRVLSRELSILLSSYELLPEKVEGWVHVGSFEAQKTAALTTVLQNCALDSDCVTILRDYMKEVGVGSFHVLGSSEVVRNFGVAARLLQFDSDEVRQAGGSNVTFAPGLFHWTWNMPMKLIWTLYYAQIRMVAAAIKQRVYPDVMRTYAAHDRVIFAALSVFGVAVFRYWKEQAKGTGSSSDFFDWLNKSVVDTIEDTSGIANMKRFVVFLSAYVALRCAVRHNDGERIFLMMKFFMPYCARFLQSQMILSQSLDFIRLIEMSDAPARAMLLANLCVNLGREGHAVAADMHMEHQIKLQKGLLRNPTSLSPEELALNSKVVDLMLKVEAEVVDFSSVPMPTTFRSQGKLENDIECLQERVFSELTANLIDGNGKSLNDVHAAYQERFEKWSASQRRAAAGASTVSFAFEEDEVDDEEHINAAFDDIDEEDDDYVNYDVDDNFCI